MSSPAQLYWVKSKIAESIIHQSCLEKTMNPFPWGSISRPDSREQREIEKPFHSAKVN